MQSLIFATSLILSTPATITTFDNAVDIQNTISIEVGKVTRKVHQLSTISAKDTFLYQAKYALAFAKSQNNTLDINSADLDAE